MVGEARFYLQSICSLCGEGDMRKACVYVCVHARVCAQSSTDASKIWIEFDVKMRTEDI